MGRRQRGRRETADADCQPRNVAPDADFPRFEAEYHRPSIAQRSRAVRPLNLPFNSEHAIHRSIKRRLDSARLFAPCTFREKPIFFPRTIRSTGICINFCLPLNPICGYRPYACHVSLQARCLWSERANLKPNVRQLHRGVPNVGSTLRTCRTPIPIALPSQLLHMRY